NNVVVLKTADDLDHRVRFANICQELIAQALSLRSSTNEAGDIDELHDSRHDRLRPYEFCEGIKAFVGHSHDTHIRLDGSERRICRKSRHLCGQSVKKRRFTNVGQPNYTGL